MVEDLLCYTNTESVIDRIKRDSAPLVMYGAGKMALDVIDVLEDNSITVSDVVVDDRFHMPGERLRDHDILSFSEAGIKYGTYSVVLGRSDYSKTDEIKSISGVNNVYYLTSPSYKMTERITKDDIKEYSSFYNRTYDLLADDLSRDVFISWINARINDDASMIFPYYTGIQTYFENDVYTITKDCNFVDIGAFTGDTVEEYHSLNKDGYIWAFEADKDNFNKVTRTVNTLGIENNIETYNMALWSTRCTGSFGGTSPKNTEDGFVEKRNDGNNIELYTLDEVLAKRTRKAGLIKVNFPGGGEVLKGAFNVIRDDSPYIAARVGFNKYEIGTIPTWIHDTFPEYKLYMRYNMCIPAGLCLYATPKGQI